MYFRPYPVLTLICAPALAILIALGVWQLQRAGWKEGLIADFERQAGSAPMELDAALCKADPVGRIVSVAQVEKTPVGLASGARIRMFGTDGKGRAGWRQMIAGYPPSCIDELGRILVQAGFEPVDKSAPAPKPADRYLITQWPPRSAFEAENDPKGNDWHWFDAPAIAKSVGADKVNDRFYLAPFNGQLPDALARVPPAQHYGYALTWFGIAAGLAAIYAAFHARAGRLRFTRQAQP
jgi:surfeit locus 1 family protein